MKRLTTLFWPSSRLAEALETLARKAGLELAVPGDPTNGGSPPGEGQASGGWIEWAADRYGLEAQAVDAALPDVPALLRAAGPALIHCHHPEREGWLLLLRARRGSAVLIGTDLKPHRLPLAELRNWLCAAHEAPAVTDIERLLERSRIPRGRWPRALSALLQERLRDVHVGDCWLLRLPPSANSWRQMSVERLPLRLLAAMAVYAAVYGLEILGWSLIGKSALEGRLDLGWFWAWLVLILTLVPLELLGGWITSRFALDAGRLLKLRLMAGALGLDPQEMRTQGAGQLLGRVIESQALESLTLNGGLSVLTAIVELGFAGWVLSLGAGGGWLPLFMVIWMVLAGWQAWRYYRALAAWSDSRLELTNGLVERMVGHRTCLAQESPGHRDGQQDRELQGYLQSATAMDQALVPLAAVVPRGWLLLGVAGLAPAYVGGVVEPVAVAISLGGILLAGRVFSQIAGGFSALARTAVVWKRVSTLFHAAASTEAAVAVPVPRTDQARAGDLLMQSEGIGFRYRSSGEPVLKGGALTIRRGDRLLLEGPSGGGKSTFASLLVGLRQPTSGLLLLEGLDRATLGAAWCRKTVAAPQFHENHVLGGSFAFNLLMGRGWPATSADLDEAEALCRKLGLGDLLDRMPGGMMQIVGETGWQLSHGERSRLFLARALLQKADLTVLDESFAALDPENLRQCLECALEESNTLLVIAHP
jgi:ATP-binding cassette subfamily B protein